MLTLKIPYLENISKPSEQNGHLFQALGEAYCHLSQGRTELLSKSTIRKSNVWPKAENDFYMFWKNEIDIGYENDQRSKIRGKHSHPYTQLYAPLFGQFSKLIEKL